MADVAILLLAAGASARMRGADKLLLPVGGIALLRRQAVTATQTGARVFVTLPPDAPERRAALAGLKITALEVAGASEGMAASLRAGVAAMPSDAAAMMIVLADMPDLTKDDLSHIINEFRGNPDVAILRGACAGVPGHPVLLPRRFWPGLATISGDQGARQILAAHRGDIRLVALPGQHAITDLDTPEAWAAWRARTGITG